MAFATQDRTLAVTLMNDWMGPSLTKAEGIRWKVAHNSDGGSGGID